MPISPFSFSRTSYTLEPTALQAPGSPNKFNHFAQVHYRTAPGLPIVFFHRYTIKNKTTYSVLLLEDTLPVRSLTISTAYCSWFPPTREFRFLSSFFFPAKTQAPFFGHNQGPGIVLPPPARFAEYKVHNKTRI